MNLVTLDTVSKKYGNFQAVKDISFKICNGEILTLLGPNGAGKSTTIGMILNLIKPTVGTIEVLGGEPSDIKVRKKLGATPQDSHFPENATSKEILNFVASHYDNPLPHEEVVSRFQLTKFTHQKVQTLSGGQRRCLSLACAFIGQPELVILDEPTTGLDVDVRRNLWNQVEEFRNSGGSVLLTTHYLDEAESISDRIVVVNKGQIVREGTPKDIKSSFRRVQISFSSAESLNFPEDLKVSKSENTYSLVTQEPEIFIKETLVKLNFSDLEVRQMSLEDAFLEILRSEK